MLISQKRWLWAMQPSWALLACFAFLLAGCAGSPAATPSDGASPVEAAGGGDGARLHALRGGQASAVHKTLWANGTFAAQESCNTGGCGALDSSGLRVTDVTQDLPAGLPVVLQADLTYQPGLPFLAQFDVWIEAPESVVFSVSHAMEEGRSTASAVLLPGASVSVVAVAYNPADVPSAAY